MWLRLGYSESYYADCKVPFNFTLHENEDDAVDMQTNDTELAHWRIPKEMVELNEASEGFLAFWAAPDDVQAYRFASEHRLIMKAELMKDEMYVTGIFEVYKTVEAAWNAARRILLLRRQRGEHPIGATFVRPIRFIGGESRIPHS